MIIKELPADTPYTLIYDANGGANAPESISSMGNEKYNIFHISENTPARPGYIFKGWSLTPDGEVILHTGDLYTVTEPYTTLYATWSLVATESSQNLEETTAEEVEPLGVSTSSVAMSVAKYSPGSEIIYIIGAGMMFAAVMVTLINHFHSRAHEPRIISSRYVDEEK